MSVFSFIKKGRQAAKEHNARQAEKEKLEKAKVPYKHVPQHAAIDALSGGPATWRDVDRPKILEQNRRRSAMTATGVGMSGTMTPIHHGGMPRVHSALSHVSYPSAFATPHVHMPRSYSYSSMAAPGWSHYGSDVTYTPLAGPSGSGISAKGKEVGRIMVDSGRASRASSQMSIGRTSPLKDMAISPVGSSGNSTSSQDDLEMKPIKHASSSAKPHGQTKSTSEPEVLHRLHPSHSRRISDSAHARGPASSPRYGTSRNSSSASLAAAGIPPVPALPAMQVGTAMSTSAASLSGSSTASSTTVVPASSNPSVTKLPAPVPVPLPSPVVEERGESRASANPADIAIGVAVTQPPAPSNRRMSKYTHFTELETISSEVSADVQNLGSTLGRREKDVVVSTITSLPTHFDESMLPAPQPVLPPPRTGKLSKNSFKTAPPSAKPPKKNRWSLRSSKSTAVAV